MFLMRFTERAYVAYSEEDVRSSFRSSVRLTFPNSHFNPALGADMYNEYLDEYEYADAIGFDGLMLNEHHNTPMASSVALASYLRSRTDLYNSSVGASRNFCGPITSADLAQGGIIWPCTSQCGKLVGLQPKYFGR